MDALKELDDLDFTDDLPLVSLHSQMQVKIKDLNRVS